MFAQPGSYATPVWYSGSLTCVLNQLIEKTRGVLPPEVHTSLSETAGRTFIQESYIADLQTANPGRPVSSEPLFVYNGYMSALGNLLRVLTMPGFEGTPRGQVCHVMHMRLQSVLNVISIWGSDVSGQFRDPRMAQALDGLAKFLSAF